MRYLKRLGGQRLCLRILQKNGYENKKNRNGNRYIEDYYHPQKSKRQIRRVRIRKYFEVFPIHAENDVFRCTERDVRFARDVRLRRVM